jgi:hypothetical protein
MEKLYRKKSNGRYEEVEKKLSLNQEIVLSCAFRYALGRMTYVVGSVCEELIKLEPLLHWNFKERTAREIQEYQDENGKAGMSFDNEEWEYIKCLFDKDRRYIVEANKFNTDEWVEVECFLHTNGEYYMLGENINKGYLHTTRNERKICNFKI